MIPYPPPATSSYLGLVQLPTGMTALSDWLDQDVTEASSPTFSYVQATDLTVTNDIGVNGSSIGVGATAGLGCTAHGAGALASNISGTNNVAYGNSALNALTTGIDNVAVGNSCGSFLTDGAHNVIGGTGAGRLTNAAANVTSITSCVILGDAARVSGSSDTNSIVIGDDARGEGSNTTVVGNADTTSCHLFGTPKFGDGTDETKTATLDLSGITTATNRTLTLPDASGTIVIGGGTCSGTSSGTNTGDQSSVTGNAGTATALQTSRTIGGSSFDGTANVTSFPEPGAIGGTTPSTGRFTRVGVGVAASGAASALLCIGGNPTNFTGANYAAVVDATNGGAMVLAKDSTNYCTWQYSNASGAFTALTVESGVAYTTTMVMKSGCILVGGTTVPSGATRNLVFEGGSTSPVLGAATADCVPVAGIDVAAGDRQLYARTEGNQANRLTGLSCRVSTNFSKTSDTTLANITGLTRNVMAGEVYGFRAVLFTTSNVAGGVKAAIGGTATATSIIAEADVKDASTLIAAGTTRVTALATTFGDATAVTAARITIEGQIVVNAAGTLTVQFAQNVSNGTASTVLAGSYFELISIGS